MSPVFFSASCFLYKTVNIISLRNNLPVLLFAIKFLFRTSKKLDSIVSSSTSICNGRHGHDLPPQRCPAGEPSGG
jgi:hypothetical protein